MSVQQLHTYVRGRLDRWAVFRLWRLDLLNASPTPARVTSWFFALWMRPHVRVERVPITERSRCPVDALEGGATDVCVEQLHTPYRDAIVASYLTGGTAEEKSALLRCSRRTFFYRLDHAHAELLGLFNDYEAGLTRVDVAMVSDELNDRRMTAPPSTPVVSGGALKRPAMHGIARAIVLDKDCTPD